MKNFRFIKGIELALFIILGFMGNAFADTKGATDLKPSDSQCRATYAADEGTLHVPCIKVLNPVEEPQVYAAELQQIPDTEPLQFSVTKIVESNGENQEDSCLASLDDGTLFLPCISVLEPTGSVMPYGEGNLEQVLSTKSLIFATVQSINDNQDTAIARRTRRRVDNNVLSFQHPVKNIHSTGDCGVNQLCYCRLSENNCLQQPRPRHVGFDYFSDANSGISTSTPTYAVNFGLLKQADNGGYNMGNIVVVEHVLNTGEKWLSLNAHLAQVDVTNIGGSRIAKNQQIGIIGCSGNTNERWCDVNNDGINDNWNRHNHFEFKKAEINIYWPYGYMDQSEANTLKIPEDGNGNVNIGTAISRNFREISDLQGQTVLIPYFSATNTNPSVNNYNVYGIANRRFYASITLTPSQQMTFTNLGVGGRLYSNDNAIRDIFIEDLHPVNFNAGQSKTLPADGTLPLDRRSRIFTEGDYKFFAYSDNFGGGYPLKVSILPNDNSKIVDNDSRIGFSKDGYDDTRDVAGYYLSAYLYPGRQGKWAAWKPSLLPGNYEIWVHVPRSATATNVRYKIYPNGRPNSNTLPILSTAINHSTNQDRWVQLTANSKQTWYFTNSGYVGISIDASGGNTYLPQNQFVGIDAVKFVYVPDDDLPDSCNIRSPLCESDASWHGNGSLISYHGRLIPNNAGTDWPYGITQDVVQLHASSGKPVGFFQWQINENGCRKLKLDADLPYSQNEVDITLGSWSNRNDDITFSKVKLPFVLGESNTGYRFEMKNGNWYVVKVALRKGLSQNVKLYAYCTYDTPTSAYYQRGSGDSVVMAGGYQWHGNASVISHLFRNLYSQRNQKLNRDWPYAAFQDVVNVHPSSAKPMVFFQWQRDSVCSNLTLDSDLSNYEKRVDIHVKSWSASNDAATVYSNKTLPYTIYDNKSDGSWSVIQIQFRNPVSKAARVTAKCPGT